MTRLLQVRISIRFIVNRWPRLARLVAGSRVAAIGKNQRAAMPFLIRAMLLCAVLIGAFVYAAALGRAVEEAVGATTFARGGGRRVGRDVFSIDDNRWRWPASPGLGAPRLNYWTTTARRVISASARRTSPFRPCASPKFPPRNCAHFYAIQNLSRRRR